MKRLRSVGFLMVFAAVSLYWAGCSNPAKPEEKNQGGSEINTNGPGAWDPVWACPSDVSAGGLDLSKDNLGISSPYVIIKFKNGGADATYSETNDAGEEYYGSTLTVEEGGDVVLNVSRYYAANDIPYNIILTGTTANGSLRIEGGSKKTLYLNGVSITNASKPAINIHTNKRTDVHLVGSCERRNILTGAGYETTDKDDQGKGAIFAEGSLVFGGTGTLEVRSKEKHAIVSDEFIEIESGSVIIYESKNDGIHANERITVKGGKLQIKCAGDAIQNERRTTGKGEACPITVSGGDIKIRTTGVKGHGIVSDSNDVVISGDAVKIDITLTGSGSKGIRSRGGVAIDGGDIYLEAHGARESVADDTSSAAGIRTEGDVEIKKGKLTVKSTRANENGKGFNIDGNLTVNGGTTNITADGHGIKLGGSMYMNDGYLKSKSANKRDIDCVGEIKRNGGTLLADNIKQGN